MSTDARGERLRAALPSGTDAILVTGLVNVRWLTGFTGSTGAALVVASGPVVLATDGRYETQARGECPGVELLVTRTPAVALLTLAGRLSVRRLAVEHNHVTLAQHGQLRAAAPAALELAEDAGTVEGLRMVKDDAEMGALAQACRLTDEVFAEVLQRIRPGVTEADVSWLLRAEMHRRGAQPAFDSIVAFGDDTARPHHRPTSRPVESGDLVTLDFGAEVDGYHADMTRTFVVGPAAGWQRELHALVRDIQRDAVVAAQPDALPRELDADVRRRIADAGHVAAHGLGHGVGLEIHEAPFLTPESTAARLVGGVPVTVEPGIYLPGRGGVRIEDTVVVRTGGADTLTRSPRDLIEI